VKWCSEVGISLIYNILYGFPLETPDDYTDLPEIFLKMSHLQTPYMYPVQFQRFSPYDFDRDRFKLKLKPHYLYKSIYPSWVDLEKIAFTFQGKWEGKEANPDEYIQPARIALRRWRKHQGQVFCAYQESPDGVTIVDNRPRTATVEPSPKGYRLNERLSAIVIFCNENRSFRSILTMIQERFGAHVTEQTVRNWLQELVSLWVVYREGDRYLTLAIDRLDGIPKMKRGKPGMTDEPVPVLAS
jgi:hypothetical protein